MCKVAHESRRRGVLTLASEVWKDLCEKRE